MDVATLIILIVVGGVILWGALTDWTFSGLFDGRGGAERDSPPGPISDVQLEVATGESGGRRESYTTLDEMKGLSITVSFNTPKSSFGYGDLELKDYVISLGTATGNNPREDLLAVIVIPRNNATGGIRLITSTKDSSAPGGIALSGDFNATDTRVSITLSDPVWTAGEIILPAGDVFLGIDYTSKEVPEGHVYELGGEADKPAGNYTKYFIPGGVTLSGTIQDNGVFVVNPDVTETINEELDIAMGSGDIGGELYIRKQIGNESRFLISPADDTNRYLRTQLGEVNERGAIVVSIFGEPLDKCRLNKFDAMPTRATASFTQEFLNGISEDDFLGPESNWFNFAVIEDHSSGWVRLGLISNFEKADETGSKIKLADFPVIHPVHRLNFEHNYLSFHTYNNFSLASTKHHKTYFRFVSPLDSRNNPNSENFSLCVRRVHNNDADNALSNLPIVADDFFLTYDIWTKSAVLKRLRDITNLSLAVFTMRNPDSSPPASPPPPPPPPPTPTDRPPVYSVDGYTHTAYMDRAGENSGEGTTVTLAACKTQCDNMDGCAGFSYYSPWCFTKGGGVMNIQPTLGDFTFYEKNGGAQSQKDCRTTTNRDTCENSVYYNTNCTYKQGSSAGCNLKNVTYTYTRDRDRPGHDIDLTTYDVNVNRGTCQSQCDNKNDCVGYSYSDFYNACYLKKASVMGADLVNNRFTFYKKNT
jgi:hypothetical protein